MPSTRNNIRITSDNTSGIPKYRIYATSFEESTGVSEPAINSSHNLIAPSQFIENLRYNDTESPITFGNSIECYDLVQGEDSDYPTVGNVTPPEEPDIEDIPTVTYTLRVYLNVYRRIKNDIAQSYQKTESTIYHLPVEYYNASTPSSSVIYRAYYYVRVSLYADGVYQSDVSTTATLSFGSSITRKSTIDSNYPNPVIIGPVSSSTSSYITATYTINGQTVTGTRSFTISQQNAGD